MEIIPGSGSWRVRKRRKFKLRWVIYLLAAIFVIFFILRVKQPANSPKPNLKTVVEKALTNSKGTYALAIKNLKTGESFYLNKHKVFEAGSLYKIWIMAEAFQQIAEGTLKEDQLLSEDVAILHEKFNISSQSAELRKGQVTLTVKEALTQMITISHNYAALLLTEKVKISAVKTFLERNNFKESSVGEPPTTTVADMALFFEKLYKGELGNPQSTQEMIDLLKKQTINDKLPKYLPKEVSIAHKTAEIGYFTHDAGIVFTPKGDFIIVILSESDYPPGAEERIAQISQAVYEYFEKR